MAAGRAAGVAMAETPKRKRGRVEKSGQTQGGRVPVVHEAVPARAAGLRTPSAPDAAGVSQETVARGGGNTISGGHIHPAGLRRKPSGEGTADPVTGGTYGWGVTGGGNTEGHCDSLEGTRWAIVARPAQARASNRLEVVSFHERLPEAMAWLVGQWQGRAPDEAQGEASGLRV
jgi:hypothetical protein